jgi:pimeloyl-ACP methyl ester carboxylesterase
MDLLEHCRFYKSLLVSGTYSQIQALNYLIPPGPLYLKASFLQRQSHTMPSTKPTLVLIHGGWGTPTSYTALTQALESAGHKVHVPTLPSMSGARPPTAGLKEDTAHVRAYIANLLSTGESIAVIMHSYGGQVGTNALAGLGLAARQAANQPGGISHLIYMSAFALPPGKSMIDKVREHDHEDFIPYAFDFADDMSVLPRDPSYLIGEAPGLDEAVVEAYAAAMVKTRWNGQCMYDAIEACAWREKGVKVAYVMATADTCVPVDYQRGMVEAIRGEGVEVGVWEVETGHCPNLTATAEVVKAVGEIVG